MENVYYTSINSHSSKQMLAIVNKGDRRPVFSLGEHKEQCPGGNDIPFIDGDISQRPLGPDDTMSYSYPFQKARVYWVPSQFLPQGDLNALMKWRLRQFNPFLV